MNEINSIKVWTPIAEYTKMLGEWKQNYNIDFIFVWIL